MYGLYKKTLATHNKCPKFRYSLLCIFFDSMFKGCKLKKTIIVKLNVKLEKKQTSRNLLGPSQKLLHLLVETCAVFYSFVLLFCEQLQAMNTYNQTVWNIKNTKNISNLHFRLFNKNNYGRVISYSIIAFLIWTVKYIPLQTIVEATKKTNLKVP